MSQLGEGLIEQVKKQSYKHEVRSLHKGNNHHGSHIIDNSNSDITESGDRSASSIDMILERKEEHQIPKPKRTNFKSNN